ncbi:MAG: Uma2 family endonuclease [Fuerstia sp.]|nr:Uma2 family endonuclease [Fuerstiella sp.]
MSLSITSPSEWTAVDLAELLGPVPLQRICMRPAPGTGDESDVVRFEARENRLFELFRGVLVEKSMGFFESYLAGVLLRIIGNFVEEKKLGIVAGADGAIRLSQGLIRIPDVAYYSFQRLTDGRIPSAPIADLVPNLVIEVLSRSNTREEMTQKLKDYFEHGVQLVWYVQPAERSVMVFADPEDSTTLNEIDELSGGHVLPGFRLSIRQLFREPQPSQDR